MPAPLHHSMGHDRLAQGGLPQTRDISEIVTMPDTDQELRNQIRLWELIWGCAASQAIHVAAELDIPGFLQERPRTCEEIASGTSPDAWTLGGVLRVLSAC